MVKGSTNISVYGSYSTSASHRVGVKNDNSVYTNSIFSLNGTNNIFLEGVNATPESFLYVKTDSDSQVHKLYRWFKKTS